ncbi:unnamed protein product, partial [Allacma fusca]
ERLLTCSSDISKAKI